MKSLLFAFLVIALAKQSREYQYDQRRGGLPAANFRSQIIKGNNGRNYEVTVVPSRTMYESSLPPQEQVFVIQHLNRPPAFGLSSQNSFNFNLDSSKQNGAQNRYNKFLGNAGYQQQQVAGVQQQPLGQPALITRRAQRQQPVGDFPQITTQQQQLAGYPQAAQQQQQYTQLLQQLLNNNPKYVSQSEASQLDVYPFKQFNGNPRSFTRTISKCDVLGKCEPQNAADGVSGGNGDGDGFHQQQVLKQPTAQVQPGTKKCQNKIHNTSEKPQSQGRRLFPYSEVVTSQNPYN